MALAAVGGVLLVVLLVAAGTRPSPLWHSLGVLLAVGAAAAAIAVVAHPWRRWRGDEAVARYVGERSGDGDLVLSAVELARALERQAHEGTQEEPGPSDAPLLVGSPSLARAHVEQAAARLSSPANRGLVPLAPARRRTLALASTLLLY